MKPQKLSNFILIPKLKSIFGDLNHPVTCLEYLQKVYNKIPYTAGLADVNDFPTIHSDILNFILADTIGEDYPYHRDMALDGLEGEFIVDIYYILNWDEETNSPEYTLNEDVARKNPRNLDEHGHLMSCGTTYEFPMNVIIENKEKYKTLIESLEDEFNEEYQVLLDAYKKLLK